MKPRRDLLWRSKSRADKKPPTGDALSGAPSWREPQSDTAFIHTATTPGLILATVDAATGSPGPEPSVTSPDAARPPVLSRDRQRKLGNASSSSL
ncbi:hypothetical protein EYF80_050584 [Liparis tanakae]|uniref:Uncharacterized protein n=1 Tax=Liparis tanakae TaxID=230148 RepID=A0A4Z2FED7_9TELE|nr:hypothetical protein EYF80_050584 [Liparis tanakae]